MLICKQNFPSASAISPSTGIVNKATSTYIHVCLVNTQNFIYMYFDKQICEINARDIGATCRRNVASPYKKRKRTLGYSMKVMDL